MASSQHRCVFVGNIPYDATEEKLIEICREVGPVVSFRLVIDRETGKPKGYGFCEYKDEETALSARRNLQGYEINGRQLRVDFAENDKGSDRNREQGRGGPGLTTNVGGPAVLGESALHQPIGLHLAITAAAVMAEALGGVQAGLQPNQNAFTSQPAPATDPLTLHLAKMSRSQLNEIISELKKIGTQNKELARKLLLAKPQLLKAIFQIQIMLGMVSSQTMPNIRQPAGQPAQMSFQDGQHSLRTTAQILPQKVQTGLTPQVQGQMSAMHHNSLAHNQLSTTLQSTLQPRLQLPQHSSNHVPPPAVAHSVVPVIPSTDPSVRPQFHLANSSSLNQHLQPSLPHSGQLATANVSQSNRMVLSNAALQSAPLTHPPISDTSFQPQLASDLDPDVIQQVLKLTPEQLSSLPPEQRQQVIQLQQALRQPS